MSGKEGVFNPFIDFIEQYLIKWSVLLIGEIFLTFFSCRLQPLT